MIEQQNRFHGRASIRRIYGASKTVRLGTISLRYRLNPRASTYRAAVVVSRKVSKSAVVRNRIRRRIYENVRILSSDFTGAYDLVFTAHAEHAATNGAQEITHEIQALFQKAKIIPATPAKHAIVEAKENQN